MLSLIGSCIPLKVSLTVIKKVFLFFRVIIEYRELDTPKDVLEELCEDDYSDAAEVA